MKKQKEKVLAYGEATGHKHQITQDVYLDEKTGLKEFKGATRITHEEHNAFDIPLPTQSPEETWVSGVVQEYDPFLKAKHNAID